MDVGAEVRALPTHLARLARLAHDVAADWRRWPPRGEAVVALAVLVGLTAALTTVVVRANEHPPPSTVAARCARATASAATRRGLDTGVGPDVVVIGDSYAVGAGGDPSHSWPVRLPGRVHVDAFSGSGFSEADSPCGQVSYADRATRALAGHPDALVVVEGGLNDHAQTDRDIQHGFVRLMRELAGHPVLVVGPPPAPARAPDVPRVDAVLRRMATGFGATYLSTADADLEYLPDGLHPDARGHRRFGDLVARAVLDLGTGWISAISTGPAADPAVVGARR